MNTRAAYPMIDLTPTEFYLSQNYPNPFSQNTTIKFCVPYKTKVKLEVFDSEGNMIKELLDEIKEAGTYEVEFHTKVCHSSEGGNLTGGMHFYRFEAGNYKNEKQMVVLK